MMQYDNALQIISDLDIAVDIAMQRRDMVDWPKVVLGIAIRENVYEKYDPLYYERRYGEGGLGDYENMEATYDAGTHTLEIEDVATGNPRFEPTDGRIDEIVENGGPWNYALRPDPGPRPFYSKAEELMESRIGEYDAALEEIINNILNGT